MKTMKMALAALAVPLLTLSLGVGSVQAETVRDCTLTGTVERPSKSSDNVYVSLHSVKPAEEGAPCKVRRREKLQFKLPASREIAEATPGTRVEYRYTEDSVKGESWKLQKVSR